MRLIKAGGRRDRRESDPVMPDCRAEGKRKKMSR